MYDCTHYALHHVDGKNIRDHTSIDFKDTHNQHHFKCEEAGFGVSSKVLGHNFCEQTKTLMLKSIMERKLGEAMD